MIRKSLRAKKSINYLKVVQNKNSYKVDETNDGNDETLEPASDSDYKPYIDSADDSSSGWESLVLHKKQRLSQSQPNDNSYLAILGASDDDDEENEYKLQRQKNMADRLNVLKLMDVEGDLKELAASPIRAPIIPGKAPKDRQSTRKQPSKASSKEPLSQRRSTRLLTRNSTASSVDFGNESTRTNDTEDEEIKPRILEENLNLDNYDDENFLKRLKTELSVPYNSIGDFVTCDFDKFSETVRSCHMFEEPTKIIPSRITSLDFHPSEKKLLLLSGDKNGNVSLWDVAAHDGVTFQAHAYSTNCVSFSKEDSSKFYSTSLDGTTRKGDLNTHAVDLLYTADGDNDDDETHTTWHHELGSTLMIAKGDGSVKLIDLRASNEVASTYKCHKRSVRTIQSHPENDNYFLTSSGTGVFGIYDLRNIKSKEPKPIILEDLGKALTSAFYSATGSYVLTTSNDDTIRIYDCRNNKSKELVRIPHNNHCGRWLSVIKAKWQPQREDCFYVGSLLAKPKRIQAYKLNGKLLHELSSPTMETYSPVVTIHPTKPIIVGGNASGRIHLYCPFKTLDDI